MRIKKPNTLAKMVLTACTFFAINHAGADEIDAFLEKTMSQRKIPGLQLAIVKNKKIIKTASYGIANLQDSVAVSAETVFPINSMTKLFTGVAIMQLVEQGKLQVSDKISKHLPDLPNDWRSTTVEQLLAHTSGLPDIMSGHFTDLIPAESPQAAWEMVKAKPREFKANTRFSYNQTGYILLGKIIDRLSGQPFVDFIIDNQLKKLNMPRTQMAGFGYFQYVIPNQSRQYFYNSQGKLETGQGQFAPFLRTAAGMSSTAKELALYSIALQQGKILIEPNSLKTLWSPAVLDNGQTAGFNSLENGYALGWQVLGRPVHPGVSASGANANTLIIYPDDDLSIVVLTNLIGGLPIEFVDEIAGFYIPEMQAENGWGVPVAVHKLHQALKIEGFDKAIEVADQLQNTQQVVFDVDELNSWGYKFINENKPHQALAIFGLNVYLFPKVANTFDSLAETYASLGNKKRAVENYQKALKLDPDNSRVKSLIETLSSSD